MRRPPRHATKSKECLLRRVVWLIQDANKDLKRVLLILHDVLTKGIVIPLIIKSLLQLTVKHENSMKMNCCVGSSIMWVNALPC